MAVRSLHATARVGGDSRVVQPGRVRMAMESLARTLRTIIGAPDYERYVEHVRQCHPDREPLPREEFHRQRLADRYSKPGTRCC